MQNRHQWEVADLRAAGLNPILSAKNAFGGGLGNSAMAQTPQYSQNMAAAAHSAVALAKARQEIDNLEAVEKNTKTDTVLKSKQAGVQQNIKQTTDLLAEAITSVTEALGGEGTGAASGKELNERIKSGINKTKNSIAREKGRALRRRHESQNKLLKRYYERNKK